MIKERDPERETMRKLPHCFIHGRRGHELDECLDQLAGLWILEIEVENIAAPVSLPPWVADAADVTDDPDFSSYNLALRKQRSSVQSPVRRWREKRQTKWRELACVSACSRDRCGCALNRALPNSHMIQG